ncbi:hypothetical protein [Rhodococcus opacus]|uniref:hypothetical protein n=1 Tax=Rhodococcus opacus TaxID=37919 RepID=UPI002953F724|nr:hypothetical protein [Rhodococcus opacus]MDV7085960.1 hypothetical protein [Rhodococcus opacus]
MAPALFSEGVGATVVPGIVHLILDKIGVVMKSTALTTHLYAPSTDLWDWQMNATCRSMEPICSSPPKVRV